MFDNQSGRLIERLVFNNRRWILIVFALLTACLSYSASQLKVNASFDAMMPQSHPFIQNYFRHKAALAGLGNSLRIVIENPQGDIFDPAYLAVVREVNDKVFLTPGVDRTWQRSLWTPLVRWTQVTEEGFSGGPVMPDDYDSSPASLERLRQNIAKANIVGSIVGSDMHSSMIVAPVKGNSVGGKEDLDYAAFIQQIEQIRQAHESPHAHIYVIGFAQLMGDLIQGIQRVMAYFAAAALIAALVIYAYSRCLRSTALVLGCSLVAVTWQLGMVHLLGFSLDPYSMLVPFLVFAIGVSHGAQKMNGVMQDVGRGVHRYVAARHTFRRLFLAGCTALLADAMGFAVMMVIDIPVIRDLAMAASVGVAVLIFTNLVLLPVALSYIGVSPGAAKRGLEAESKGAFARLNGWLVRFTERRYAVVALVVAALLGLLGLAKSAHLQVGDLDPGAPELRADSRYNLDNAYITTHYRLSSDQFAVLVETPVNGCSTYDTLVEVDRLTETLRDLPNVQTVVSAAPLLRNANSGNFEGNPKFLSISRNDSVRNAALSQVRVANPEIGDKNCGLLTVSAYLADHKAQTISDVVEGAERFAAQHDIQGRKFLLAAGSAGIEAATNVVVRKANRTMLILVYAAVAVLCFITFRNWRAVIVALVPLVLTSILCEALMAWIGIGIKVATLPVIALGVGIGVDYALYLISVQLAVQAEGRSLREAYARALSFTGKVVALVGVTLAAGVVTWALSPIKFQADMGLLLTFMFLWNMVGALILIPALSHFLLNKNAETTSTPLKVAT